MSALAAGVAVLALVLLVPGWAAARALGLRADLFARVWLGLGVTSIVALRLAHAGAFSLPALLGSLATLSAACALVAWLRTRRATGRTPSPVAPEIGGDVRAARAFALTAGLAAVLWSWPPFETVIAASDSTMYVNAGIHLARTGSLAVSDTVVRLIWPFTAHQVFPSITWHGFGPFIRLPGGLLMADLFTNEASPAFFPLLSVWAGILAAASGPEAAPAIAPVLAGLAVWSVVLFAGETVGALAAAATALMLVASFAFWWFGRFTMAEPLACALLWGGLVFLGRVLAAREAGAALAAGALLGLAGLARTETFLFVAAAGVLWCVRERVPVVTVVVAAAGFAALLGFAASTVGGAPSHHLAYLMNEGGLQLLAQMPRIAQARQDGTLALAGVLVAALVLGAGLVGRWWDAGFGRGALGALALLALVASLLVYMKLGGAVRPWRHLGWLAAYCTWPQLAVASVGGIVLWRRGPAARLAVILSVLVAVVFLLNPRVAPYQPWAIRRFLPVVIPALTIAAAAALARLAESRSALRGAVVVAALGIAALEVRPILAVRSRPYFAGSFASVEQLAARFPPDAIVAMDSGFADLQFQVPLWLVHGRETLMLRGGGSRWREVMRSLLASGRPIYWVANSYGPAPSAPDLTFAAAAPDLELRVSLPDAPTDGPPTLTVNRIVPLRIYEVGAGEG